MLEPIHDYSGREDQNVECLGTQSTFLKVQQFINRKFIKLNRVLKLISALLENFLTKELKVQAMYKNVLGSGTAHQA